MASRHLPEDWIPQLHLNQEHVSMRKEEIGDELDSPVEPDIVAGEDQEHTKFRCLSLRSIKMKRASFSYASRRRQFSDIYHGYL